MLRWKLCIVLIILEFSSAVNENTWSFRAGNVRRDVEVETGMVRGYLANDGDGEYFAYLGIPYAAPPTLRGRFKDPLPPAPWEGIFSANRTVWCPQTGTGNEDCLVVNVFTPVNVINGLTPVLAYIHGGSFLIGIAQTQGVGPLIKQNIIVVTMTYRLGILGFLCLGIDEAPGNAGLKDQTLALKWIQTNIQNFGGDPAQVTLYGMSAGAALAELHVLSKFSKGLFQRAIVESGSATSVWAIDAEPINTALDFAKALQLPKQTTKNLYNLVHYFQHESAAVLGVATMDYYNNLTDGTFGFAPCVEKQISTQKTFLSRSPYEILAKQDYTKVPIMFIFACLEGLFMRSREYYEEDYKHRMEANFLDFLPADLVFDTDEIRQEIGKNIKRFYFGNKTIGDGNLVEYLNYFGDYVVLHGLLNSAEMHARDGNPVYLMEFAYKGMMGGYDKFYENFTMAGHGDVIKHAILNKPVNGKDDRQAVERVSKLIANFVRFGDPTPTPTRLLPVRWPRVQPGNVSCLHMDHEFTVLEEPYWGRKVFWDTLYSKFRRRIKPVNPRSL